MRATGAPGQRSSLRSPRARSSSARPRARPSSRRGGPGRRPGGGGPPPPPPGPRRRLQRTPPPGRPPRRPAGAAPSAAESVMVRRDIELAQLTGGRVHLAHLSCRASFDALRNARQRVLAVTGETCPHYWTLTDEAVGDYDTHAKMNPPLRSASDRDAVIAAVAEGPGDRLPTHHPPPTT